MRTQSHEHKLGGLYQRGVADTETWVSHPQFCDGVTDAEMVCRGELKIAEVASRFVALEAFMSLVSSVGFKLRSKVF